MPRIWARNDREEWHAVQLGGTAIALGDEDPSGPAAVLMPSAAEGRTFWCLVASPGQEQRVNGWAISGGVRILSDRDEIRLPGGERYFYSDADPAEVRPLPASIGATLCALCTGTIEVGSDAVRCPRCDLWHHANETRNCWTYNPTCSHCDQPTALTGESAWSPCDD